MFVLTYVPHILATFYTILIYWLTYYYLQHTGNGLTNKKLKYTITLCFLGFSIFLYSRFGFTTAYSTHIITLLLLMVATQTDVIKMEIPLGYLLTGLLPIVCIIAINGHTFFINNTLPSLLMAAIFMFIAWITKGHFGFGDAIMIGILALLQGYLVTISIVLIAMILTAIAGIFLISIKRANRKKELPFVPFILITYILYILI